MRTLTRTLTTAVGATLALAPMAPAMAAPVIAGPGLVNVAVDVDNVLNNNEILSRNNVAIGVAANLVANVCPNLNVSDIALLAVQANQTDVEQTATCIGEAGPAVVRIAQAQ